MRIDNYPNPPSVAQAGAGGSFVVGVVDLGTSEHSRDYTRAVATALQMQPAVERVVFPYGGADADVDVLARVAVRPEYRGAGTNFLVNWPGFLVFAPAWNGYKYRANPRTEVELVAADGRVLDVVRWEHEYVFHQADSGRTWTQLGWLEYGVIPLIGGIVFTRYDTDQTRPFIYKVEHNYGQQVAARITGALSGIDLADLAPEAGQREPALPRKRGRDDFDLEAD